MKNYRLLPMSILGIAIIFLDQVTKLLVVKFMELGESIPLIDGFLYLTSHRNEGAAWGMLQGRMWLFYIITVFVIVVLVMFYKREAKTSLLLQISLVLLMAGAIGNFIDRLLFQKVVDFVDTVIFGYDFPIFNVADASLTAGVILMVIQIFFFDKGDKNEN
ncbi:lipoprotein signal peptidase [Phocicoccus schoeneichii]|uniref:Lipoprotein signal peptidase n=1 Tax=Phocicoccus schoeneichii TaxID=1812261 RepID=A0A6V7RFG9_9BACL|nr:signal peptidase II [Jeotgalicoccus schoeneichii]GGH49675.1 lipoprotein signal peptidase [Jeotgalicoccus schoeneichii]CAD2075946.1 Lipoprotein signal peptidase [Jeotgalicoccus schoeneichii]